MPSRERAAFLLRGQGGCTQRSWRSTFGTRPASQEQVYSLVGQVLYRRLPVREPERLVLLSWNGPS